jgi:hypothetical protein
MEDGRSARLDGWDGRGVLHIQIQI